MLRELSSRRGSLAWDGTSGSGGGRIRIEGGEWKDIIAQVRRTSKLGILGEVLAAETLVRNGFQTSRHFAEAKNERGRWLIARCQQSA